MSEAITIALDALKANDNVLRSHYAVGYEKSAFARQNKNAITELESLQAQEPVTDNRECYMCGRPAYEHATEANPKGGSRPGKCPDAAAPAKQEVVAWMTEDGEVIGAKSKLIHLPEAVKRFSIPLCRCDVKESK